MSFIATSLNAQPAHRTLLTEPVILGNARFTVINPICIRMEYQGDGAFVDAPSLFAGDRTITPVEVTVTRDEKHVEISTGLITLTYRPDGKPFSAHNLSAVIVDGEHRITWNPGSRQTVNLGGTIATLDQVKGPVDLGEGILSRDGWYLLDDSMRHLLVDGWVQARPAAAGTDWFLFGYGHDYKGALQAITAAGGRVPLPRKYALGSWYSRWWKYSSEDYKNIVEEYREHDFPLDIMVMDMEWHKKGWTGWSWNKDLIPDPPGLLKWFHDEGLAVTLNVHPSDGMAPHEDAYKGFMKELGRGALTSETVPFDATNKRYMDAIFKYGHEPNEKIGTDFWWLDWQQDVYTKGIHDLKNLTWLNYLYFQNSLRDGQRGMQFSRWGGWGDHKHPIHFSGDTDTGWDMLGFIGQFTATAGNVGCFYWSHDIGGHFGKRNEEVYARWVQFALTSPALRLHSGIIEYLDRRPWKWPEDLTNSMRIAFHLRSQLMPYIYSSAYQGYDHSLPLDRPLYISNPKDEEAYTSSQEYMFGDHLLAAPVGTVGDGPGRVGSQLVWWPEGMWYNIFTSERFSGLQQRLVCATIDESPLYARGGVPIPMQPYTPRMTSAPLEELNLRCYPGADGESGAFTLYEDDGISRAYEKGRCAKTMLTYERHGDKVAVSVAPTEGGYDGQVVARSYTIELPAIESAHNPRIDGASVEIIYDKDEKIARIRVPKRDIRKGFRLEVEAIEADPAYFSKRAATRRLKGVMGDDYAGTLEDALNAEVAKPSGKARGLMALAGFAVVKTPSHFPKPKVYHRLWRNPDSLIDARDASIAYVNRVLPEDRIAQREVVDFSRVKVSNPFEPEILKPVTLKLFTRLQHEVTLEARFSGKSISETEVQNEQIAYLNDWRYCGPFAYTKARAMREQTYAPESDPLHPEKNPLPKGMKWKPIAANEKGHVEFHKVMPGDLKLGYAFATIHSDDEYDATLGFRSDDGIEAWLNGERIHEHDTWRSIEHEWERVPVKIKKGSNVLLLKISQNSGSWEFSVIATKAGE